MIGRRGNGQFAARPSLTTLDAEIGEIERQIIATERAGPPLPERIAQAEAELERCEQHFRAHGFTVVGTGPQEREHFRHLAMVGALLTIGRDTLFEAERDRVRRQFEAGGGVGYSAAEKAERLAEHRRTQRRLLARHELGLRQQEGAGELIADGRRDPALFLTGDDQLQAIADEREAI